MNQGLIIASLNIPEAGYINKVTLSCTKDKLFVAGEHGIYVIQLDRTMSNMELT